MKLLRITLAPFAGVRDKTYEFTGGLNVVFGPNEFGKSTLFQAISAALFIPVKLGRNEFKYFDMSKFFPADGGTRIRIELELENNSQRFLLTKEWNNSNGTCKGTASLAQQGGAKLTDENQVQSKIASIAGLNFATWKNVLFTRQAQLDATVELLRVKKDELVSLSEIVSAEKGTEGDVDAEKLRAAVEAQIQAYYSRWDETIRQPEKGKGIENPWLKEVGFILDAYYKKEKLAAKLKIITEHEKQLGSLAKKIAELLEEINDKSAFVVSNEAAYKACGERFILETDQKAVQAEIKSCTEIAAGWAGLKASVDEKERLIPALEKSVEDLKKELDNARKRDQGVALLKDFELIRKEKEELTALQSALSATKVPDPVDLNKVSALERKIAHNKTAIAAQKLKLQIVAQNATEIELQSGVDAPQKISLKANDKLENQVEGKFTLRTRDFEVRVSNESGDAEKLFAELEQSEKEVAGILVKYEVKDATGIRVLEENARTLKNAVENKLSLYKRLLRERTFEAWEQFVSEIKNLPAAREVQTIEKEQEQKRNELAEYRAFIDQNRKQLAGWEEKYESPKEIINVLVRLQASENKLKDELKALSPLPAGFTDASAFKQQYERFQKSVYVLKDELSDNKNEESKLLGREFDESAAEVAQRLDIAIKKFEFVRKQGAALQRVLDKLNEILQEKKEKRDETAERVAHWFNLITENKYPAVQMKGGLPESVGNSQVSLGLNLLSQGTRASLALALRLAMAEIYLQNRKGFIMMDDPLTDMDIIRKTRAAKALQQIASGKQTFIFTCDENTQRVLAS